MRSKTLLEVLAPRPVTGPDGDNPITDEQIRDLRRWAEAIVEACKEARRPPSTTPASPYGRRVQESIDAARSSCAEAWNARHAQNGGAS